MIDHLGLSVSDYEAAKAFYSKALAPLDYSLIMEVTEEQTGHAAAAGFGADGKPDFWIGGEGAMNWTPTATTSRRSVTQRNSAARRGTSARHHRCRLPDN